MASTEIVTEPAFLDSVEGEIWFFKSVMHARPVGKHRHFHVMSMRNTILRETGQSIAIDDIWEKLKTCYDLDALEAIDIEAEGYESQGSKNSTPQSIPSPSPSQNLTMHPFFKEEFTLPLDQSFESLISTRRARTSLSAPSSAAASPAPMVIKSAGRKRAKNRTKANLAGLDSDSSALTQESGDEGVALTPRESVVTGTDAGTEDGEDDDAEMRDPSPEPSTATTKTRTTKSKPSKKSSTNRVRAAAAASSSRTRKRKR